MPKLTARFVEALEPTEGEVFLWDTELEGFGLRVFPTGRKAYIIQYRNSGGATRRLTLGPHGRLTTDEARRLAKNRLASVQLGSDPSTERKHERQAPNLKAFAELYLERHARIRKKPAGIENDQSMLRRYIVPTLGHERVEKINRAMVCELQFKLVHLPIRANRVLALLSKMMTLAELWGYRPQGSNPCKYVQRYPERKRERYLSTLELASLGKVLTELDRQEDELPSAVLALRLLLLTGARRNEILCLRWNEVDLERGSLRLEDSKTGRKVVPLGQAAVDLLAKATRLAGNPYVCFGLKEGQRLIGLHRIWQRARQRAGIPDVRLHDLRHTHASIAAGAGIGLPIIGKILGHTTPVTTARYAHLADDPVRQAATRVAGELAGLLGLG